MTVSGVRRSWRRFASRSASSRWVRSSSSAIALKRAVRSRTSVGPSSGSGIVAAPAGRSAVAEASRRSGCVTEREISHAIGPPTSSDTITTAGSAASRSRTASADDRSVVARTSARGPTPAGLRSTIATHA